MLGLGRARGSSSATVFLVDASGASSARDGQALAVSESSVAPLVKALRSAGALEAAVVATGDCTECYVVCSSAEAARSVVAEALARTFGTDSRSIAAALVVSQGQEAVRHLCRLAGGLEPLALGDEQLRHAYDAARAAHASGPLVHRVFQAALAVGDRAHALVTGVAREGAGEPGDAGPVALTIEAELAQLDDWRVRRDAFSMLVA